MADKIVKTAQVKSTQVRNACVLAAVVMLCLFVFMYMISSKSDTQAISKSEKDHFISPLKHIDAESVLVENTQKELQETRKQIEGLKHNFEIFMNNAISTSEMEKTNNSDLLKRVTSVEKQLSDTARREAASSSEELDEQQNNMFTEPDGKGQMKKSFEMKGIKEDSLTLEPRDSSSQDIRPLKNPDTYVPAGTFVKAVMVGGADASAAVNAQTNPVPMLFRLIAEGTLPNHQKSHLKDCFITAAVVGDISSERGQIRTESLSCVFPNGTVVDQQVEGTVFGPDGKNAVRGNKYEGGGEHVASATVSGFFSGLSKGVSETYTTNSISTLGNVSTTNPSKIFQNGFATGTSKGLEQVADYEMRRADQYHPIIQLSAGTLVDVVFLKGFYLDGKKHENHDSNVESFSNKTVTNQQELFPTPQPDGPSLPLSDENVRRIQERSKELGLRVRTEASA